MKEEEILNVDEIESMERAFELCGKEINTNCKTIVSKCFG